MRKLSLSFVALAVLSFVPASQAQQFAPGRANIQAKQAQMNAGKGNINMNRMHTPAKAFARYQAWQQQCQAQKGMHSKAAAKNVKNVPAKVNGMHVNKSKSTGVSLSKDQFGKRSKIKQAVKAAIKQRQKAMLQGKAAMGHKQR